MNLTKNQKILIGILHFLPIVGIILYFVFFFGFFITSLPEIEKYNHGEPPIEFFKGFISAFAILGITILIGIAVLVFDIVHLVKSNKNDTSNKKLLWVLVLIFAHGIGSLIYYFVEILPEKKEI